MKVAIVNLGKIVSGNWREPFAAGDTIISVTENLGIEDGVLVVDETGFGHRGSN
jgi:hypothetical protein